MQAFQCDVCGSLLFFENVLCVKCNHTLGFAADILDLTALEPIQGSQNFKGLAAAAQGREYKLCQNAQAHGACNWIIPTDSNDSYCASCSLNDLIPDLNFGANRTFWQKLEAAKRRMIYTLLKLKLPLRGDPANGRPPLRFQLLSESPQGAPIMTGHANGVITINIAEADDSERERRRMNLGEPLRTLLGHMRHEVAHYYWGELIERSDHLPKFRELFGSETDDYGQALQRYYQLGAPGDWPNRFVSAYASSHSWEDWAETTAHYFHIVDTVETAASFGVTLRPRHPDAKAMVSNPREVSQPHSRFSDILEHWLPLTYPLNELNRGMGLPDLYPFVLSVTAIQKLTFVDEVIRSAPQHR